MRESKKQSTVSSFRVNEQLLPALQRVILLLSVPLNEVCVQTEHTLEIKKIIAGGNGLGHLNDGMVVITPFVLPGERVTVAERKRFSGYIQATTMRIERPSPHRRLPMCPLFGACGGCDLQHTSYANELTIKKDILIETLTRGQALPEKSVLPPLPSLHCAGYRSKIRLHLTKKGEIGFHKAQSHEIVPVTHCPLAAPTLNNTLLNLSASGLLPELAAFCSQIELICSPDDMAVTATLFVSKNKTPRTFLKTIPDQLGIKGLMLQHKKKAAFIGKPGLLHQSFAACGHCYTLQWDSRCFFQVNPQQNQKIIDIVLAAAGDIAGKKMLDLFCGMGNFSIPLALEGAEVTGIEINKHAVTAARNNARNAKIHESRFIAADVGHSLQQLVTKQCCFDLVLLDPPRQGLGRAVELLPQTGAETILYISCDPATLVRDLKTLVKRYRLLTVIPVDMFPRTHHIECVAVLEKN